MSIVRYCLIHGVNASHLHDIEWYERLRDAKYHVEQLSPTPVGMLRSYRLERWEWRSARDLHPRQVTTLLERLIA